MNAAVHVMCFYYSSWNDKIYANIKISKVSKRVRSPENVQMASQGPSERHYFQITRIPYFLVWIKSLHPKLSRNYNYTDEVLVITFLYRI